MSDVGTVAYDNGVVTVSGRITFQTVPECLPQAAACFGRAGTDVTVDLAKVTLVDTAGVALMLEWLAQARAQRYTLTFVNLPEQLRHFINVSGLNQAFGLA
ncbi:MAG TPA: STAS domain-containing protein [Burkholderiales bacterium]|nr:STAS domain-containing protein [Burkholderiales bacterium]